VEEMWALILIQLSSANPPLIQQLSARDGSPSCQVLEQKHGNIQLELQQITFSDVSPSYVPMRAANCLLELYPSDVETYKEWMISPESKGLALLVVNKMEMLPVDVAIPLAIAGLNGAHKKGVLIRLEKVSVPQIQELLQSTEQGGD
jgi:hypothetical protein